MQERGLPAEMLSLIIDNLGKKEELEQCLLICKRWKDVAFDIFWEKMVVDLPGEKIAQFVNRLKDFPYFAARIKRLRIWTSGAINRDTSAVVAGNVKYILQAASNSLTVLDLYTPATKTFLELLNHQLLTLPHLKKFYINRDYDDEELENLYTSVLYKFRSTLTCVSLEHDEDCSAYSTYGGLEQYISYFPSLKYLYIRPFGIDINVPQVVQNCKQLKKLTVHGPCNVLLAKRVTINNNDYGLGDSDTKRKMDCLYMDQVKRVDTNT